MSKLARRFIGSGVAVTAAALMTSSLAMSAEVRSIRAHRLAGLADFVDGIVAQQIAQRLRIW